MKKMPWGILAGVAAILWSFITVALVAVFVISSMMYAEVGSDDGLSESWWLIYLYIGEAVTVIAFALNLILYIRREKKEKQEVIQ